MPSGRRHARARRGAAWRRATFGSPSLYVPGIALILLARGAVAAGCCWRARGRAARARSSARTRSSRRSRGRSRRAAHAACCRRPGGELVEPLLRLAAADGGPLGRAGMRIDVTLRAPRPAPARARAARDRATRSGCSSARSWAGAARRCSCCRGSSPSSPARRRRRRRRRRRAAVRQPGGRARGVGAELEMDVAAALPRGRARLAHPLADRGARAARCSSGGCVADSTPQPLVVLDPTRPASEEALDMAVRAAASLCVHLARARRLLAAAAGRPPGGRRSGPTSAPGPRCTCGSRWSRPAPAPPGGAARRRAAARSSGSRRRPARRAARRSSGCRPAALPRQPDAPPGAAAPPSRSPAARASRSDRGAAEGGMSRRSRRGRGRGLPRSRCRGRRRAYDGRATRRALRLVAFAALAAFAAGHWRAAGRARAGRAHAARGGVATAGAAALGAARTASRLRPPAALHAGAAVTSWPLCRRPRRGRARPPRCSRRRTGTSSATASTAGSPAPGVEWPYDGPGQWAADAPARRAAACSAGGRARVLARAPRRGAAAPVALVLLLAALRHRRDRARPGRAAAARARAARCWWRRGCGCRGCAGATAAARRRRRRGRRASLALPSRRRSTATAALVDYASWNLFGGGKPVALRLVPLLRPDRLAARRHDADERRVRRAALLEGRDARHFDGFRWVRSRHGRAPSARPDCRSSRRSARSWDYFEFNPRWDETFASPCARSRTDLFSAPGTTYRSTGAGPIVEPSDDGTIEALGEPLERGRQLHGRAPTCPSRRRRRCAARPTGYPASCHAYTRSAARAGAARSRRRRRASPRGGRGAVAARRVGTARRRSARARGSPYARDVRARAAADRGRSRPPTTSSRGPEPPAEKYTYSERPPRAAVPARRRSCSGTGSATASSSRARWR